MSMLAWVPRRGGEQRHLLLRQGRVFLRPPRASDWRQWSDLRLRSREFLVPWEPTWPHDSLTRAAFRRRLRQYALERRHNSGFSFLIFRAEDEALLGGISLSNLRRGVSQSASLGYWIGAPYVRRGYMTEALAAILALAFGRLDLHRVEAACLPDNTASQKLLLNLGFSQEGCAAGYLRINGRWQDHLLFALTREAYRPDQGRG